MGFRPFVHALADEHGLAGFVLNDGRGVVIEVEGDRDDLDSFHAALPAQAPPLARVEVIVAEERPPLGERRFRIAASSAEKGGGAQALVPPDTATCEECLRELRDPADRRYRYPFINCTQCGPRFTITERVPYDRPNTTMSDFPLCEECRAEYEDPTDRRFHAEPIACPRCGPALRLTGGRGHDQHGDEALRGAVALLRSGGIVAVKGIGGYHLACDAAGEEAVAELRSRKHRDDKPLALMTTDPESLVSLGHAAATVLRSPARPIVLAERKPAAAVAPSVAPGHRRLGVMLPYSGLHHLLCEEFGGSLVMTSGNRSDEPIAFEDAEAFDRLGAIADGFLVHDRRIHRRCEDSVVHDSFPVRRSRGYVPGSIQLPKPATRPVLAVGAELKASFCVARGGEAFISPHLGDLTGESAYRAFRDDVELYLAMVGVEPAALACDMHPDYLSTRWAHAEHERRAVAGEGLELIEVQHHHAHAASCLAEHGERGPALAVVFDGTGYGPDGTIWGGEILRCDLVEFERLAHLESIPLPGGDQAVREPWRVAAAYLERLGRPVPWSAWSFVRESLKVHAPYSSGMGRLFDAVAALLGIRERVTYEGQAAIELEQLAGNVPADGYPCRIANGNIKGSDLITAVCDDLDAGRPPEQIAAAFHEGVAAATAAICEEVGEPGTVVLTGGSFQNLRLCASVEARLGNLGHRVLTHREVPPNDGGVSYGQAAVAAGRMKPCA